MRYQNTAAILSSTCILTLSACGGGAGGSGDPMVDNGIPSGLPADQNLLVSHAAVDSGDTPTLGGSVIRVVDANNIVVTVGGETYELERTGPASFETADGGSTLLLPNGSVSGEHAGIFRFVTDLDPGLRQVSQLVGVPDAYDAIPSVGLATFTGGAHTYRTSSLGETTYSDDWDVEVIANFQVQGVGVTMTDGNRTLEMDPAGIQNNSGTAYFEETLTSSDNDPFYDVSNGTMSGLFYGDGQEVGGRFSYDLTTVGTTSTITGVFHAD